MFLLTSNPLHKYLAIVQCPSERENVNENNIQARKTRECIMSIFTEEMCNLVIRGKATNFLVKDVIEKIKIVKIVKPRANYLAFRG